MKDTNFSRQKTWTIWQEMLDNSDLLKSQYDLVKGEWPKEKDEIVLIVDENNEISDFALYSFLLKYVSVSKNLYSVHFYSKLPLSRFQLLFRIYY